MTTFTKATPGAACAKAEALGATWVWIGGVLRGQEAKLPDGTVVVYCDNTGYYIADGI